MARNHLSRPLIATMLSAALLAPVAWAGPIWADDWADETGPTDNPSTPGPDWFPNLRIDEGIASMPNLVQTMSGIAPGVFIIPLGVSCLHSGVGTVISPEYHFFGVASRAPPGRLYSWK